MRAIREPGGEEEAPQAQRVKRFPRASTLQCHTSTPTAFWSLRVPTAKHTTRVPVDYLGHVPATGQNDFDGSPA